MNHKAAEAVAAKIKNKELGQSYISDYIFGEFMTFLKAKHIPPGKIKEIGAALLSDESIRLLKVDMNVFLQSWELFKKFQKLSFTDSTTVILAKEFIIKGVASFDADFDGITFLTRIEA